MKEKKKPLEKIEMLSESMLTEDGFVNEACIKELNKVIKNMPKTHDRLHNDPEWATKRCTLKSDITGALAKWAIRQSPYSCPDNLGQVIKYLDVCLEKDVEWMSNNIKMADLSLCDISRLLYDILYEQGISYFDDWNKSKKENVEMQFASRYNKIDPDYDFIDLDALIHNVCLDIRTERREIDAFNKKFEKDYKESELL